MTITIRVDGVPQPKGSTKAFVVKGKTGPRAIVTEDNKHTRPWSRLVRDAAEDACGHAGEAIVFERGVPVRLSALFTLPRPVSLPKRIIAPTKKPDLDKLARAVKDALTGVAWQDDSQVVELVLRKRYACGAERPGAVLQIRPLAAGEASEHGLLEATA